MANESLLGKVRILTTQQGEGVATATIQSINQVGHGFVVGDVVRPTVVDNVFALAQADTAFNAEVIGIVTAVIDADNFEITTQGEITVGVPALPAATVLFLDPAVPGALTVTEPTTAGEISKPLLIIEANGARAKFFNFRGNIVEGPAVVQNFQTYASGTNVNITSNITRYLSPESTAVSTVEGNTQMLVQAGTIDEIMVNIGNFTLAGAATFNLRVNGATVWTTPIAATGDYAFSPSIPVVDLDLVNYEIVTPAGGGLIQFISTAMHII